MTHMNRRYWMVWNASVVGLALSSPAAAGNWSENWGSLIWGGAIPVPSMGVVSLLFLVGFIAGMCSTRLRRGPARTLVAAIGVIFVITPGVLRAALTIPNVFVNGTAADADEVNANFAAIETAVNLLDGASGTPLFQFSRTGGCSSELSTWVRFPRTMNGLPIFMATIDEDLDNNGAVTSKIVRRGENQTGIVCDLPSDGLHWAAFQPGVQTIDGRTVQAGREVGVVNGSVIFFGQLFAAPPVVLLYVDESVAPGGGSRVRTVGIVSAGGFQVWVDGPVDAVHWIAMPAGVYNAGGASWEAGVVAPGGCTTCTIPYLQVFGATPGLLATINDSDNSGGTWVRTNGVGTSQATVLLDASTEFIHYIAFLEP